MCFLHWTTLKLERTIFSCNFHNIFSTVIWNSLPGIKSIQLYFGSDSVFLHYIVEWQIALFVCSVGWTSALPIKLHASLARSESHGTHTHGGFTWQRICKYRGYVISCHDSSVSTLFSRAVAFITQRGCYIIHPMAAHRATSIDPFAICRGNKTKPKCTRASQYNRRQAV